MTNTSIDPYDVEEVTHKIDDNKHLLEILLEMLDRLGGQQEQYPDIEINNELKRVLPQLVALTIAVLDGTTSNYSDLMNLVNEAIHKANEDVNND